jgi:3-isopropylmalate dehydrogenase
VVRFTLHRSAYFNWSEFLDIVNPIAQILSLAMLLHFSCGMKKEADAIAQAVGKVLDSKQDGGLEIRTA